MKINCLIVDDEEDARALIGIHARRHRELSLIGEASNGKQAITLIDSLKPDLVFLDIEMPEFDGMEVVSRIKYHPIIIFITAYDEFAVNAFELNAVDYLLKPFAQNRFDQAMAKVVEKIRHQQSSDETYQQLLEVWDHHDRAYLERIPYRSGHKIIYLSVEEISHIESADQYVTIHTRADKFLIRLSMDYLEKRLAPNLFIRTHRSAIVKLSEVESIEPLESKNWSIQLKSGAVVKLSQRRKPLFQSKMGAV